MARCPQFGVIRRIRPVFLLPGVLILAPIFGAEPDFAAVGQQGLEIRIADLIEQLGASQYATREKAQVELERLRLDAFDALSEAQEHDDIEIALRARYLVRSMQVNWVTDDDSPEVKELLQSYGGRPESERYNLAEQLASLPGIQSLQPLCRLARYDRSEKLSRSAALFAMGLDVQGVSPEKVLAVIDTTLGASKRMSSNWLRTYAQMLSGDPIAFSQWKTLIDDEEILLVQSPEQTSREIVSDLLRWYTDQLTLRHQDEEALAMMRKSIRHIGSSRNDVLDIADWLRERAAWVVLSELADRFSDTFKQYPLLMFRLAETHSQLNQKSEADAAAKAASELIPDDAEKHLEVAEILQADGLFRWAAFEYRHVATMLKDEPADAIRASLSLSEMLHEIGNERTAGDVLKELVKIVESDGSMKNVMEADLGREVSSIKSRMCLFYSRYHANADEREKQREFLLEAYQNDPQDADVLIAMYRIPDANEAWQTETRQRIDQAADAFRKQIKELTASIPNAAAEDLVPLRLALANNQLAWLLGNTGENLNEALKCSLQSLALWPDRAGFLDTLGRCYYAKGDYANAVKYQSRAVTLEPHSPPLLAQLELFKKALKESPDAGGGTR